MSQTHQQAREKHYPRYLIVLAVVLLGGFAIYAPALRLMAFGADIALLPLLNNPNLVRLFTESNTQSSPYSPLSLMLWLGVKALSGFPAPSLLHFWNVWLHTLNMALLAALAWRLATLFDLNRSLFSLLSVLIFGFFPFSYEAILSAVAVNHLLMTALGLTAILVYLMARNPRLARRTRLLRLALSGLLLLAAGLSHEMGFIFGPLLLLIETAYALKERHWPHPAALVLFIWGPACSLAYQLFTGALEATAVMQGLAENAGAWYPNTLIHAQGMVAWVILLLRNMLGFPEPREWIVLVAFVVTIGIVLVGLWYVRRLRSGLLALGWWFVAMLPSTAFLGQAYLSRSPRLLYEPSIGVALLWACAVTCLVSAIRWPLIRLIILGCAGIVLAWCGMYVTFQRGQVARLTSAFRLIDADLRNTNPMDTVLLVNMPSWSAPVPPTFLLGTQGMDLSPQGRDATSNWLSSIDGIYRKAGSVRHEPTLTRGTQIIYDVAGRPVDNAALLAQLLQSNLSYRFDYDDPGLRVSRLAMVGYDQTHSPPFARFTNGDMQVALRKASASLCGRSIALELAWSDVRRMRLPTGVFVHVMDGEGNQAIVADRDLMGGYLPLDRVPTGMVITETRKINIPADVAPLKQIELGAYMRAGQVRMTAVNADGGHWEGDAVVVPIEDDNPELCRRIGE